DQKSDGCVDKLREDGESETGTPAGAEQPGLHQLLKGFNVFLEFAAQEFAGLGVKPVKVRDQHQKRAEQQHYRVKDHEGHRELLCAWSLPRFRLLGAAGAGEFARSSNDAGSLKWRRRRDSARAMRPLSDSWS